MVKVVERQRLVFQHAARALRLNLHRGGVKWPLQHLLSIAALLLDTRCCPRPLCAHVCLLCNG